VEGAELVKAGADPWVLRLRIPANSAGGYVHQKITLHFSKTTP
jgi:hypothetical protein